MDKQKKLGGERKKMKNKLILLVCICMLVVSIGIGSASANVTNIDTGENFELIQEAIDDSDTTDRHTIVVSPGVYNENVKVNKSLTIKSVNESYDDVTIIGKSLDSEVINVVTCSDVDIIGFRVIGAKVPTITNLRSVGIRLLSAQNCYIANCSVNRTNNGVSIKISSNNTIEHNDIFDNHKTGVQSYSSNDITIINNNIYDNHGEGVFLSNMSNTIIANNSIYDNREEGIFLGTSSNAVISNNTISGQHLVYSGIKLYGSNNNTISNNTVTENGQGIALYEIINSIIIGNNASNNRGDGIYLYYSICEIRRNIVCSNSRWGIHLVNSRESVVEDNICENNGFE